MAEPDKTTVLVADDEPSTLALVAGHLRTKGYQVIEASDGDQAWELACDHLPDIVVLDVMMPGMSGWEVCRKVRETVSLAHTGVVMLTGIGENLNEMTSPLYGADAHVDKPFEFSDLDRSIEQALEARRHTQLNLSEEEEDDDDDDDQVVSSLPEMDDSDWDEEEEAVSEALAEPKVPDLEKELDDEEDFEPSEAFAADEPKTLTGGESPKAAKKPGKSAKPP